MVKVSRKVNVIGRISLRATVILLVRVAVMVGTRAKTIAT